MVQVGPTRTIEQTQTVVDTLLADWADTQFGVFVVYQRGEKKPIGVCGTKRLETPEGVGRDLGFLYGKEFWGQGFGSEAAEAVMNHIENLLPYSQVTAWVNKNNSASIKILEKLRFRFVKSDTMSYAGYTYHDSLQYVWQRDPGPHNHYHLSGNR